MVQLPIWLWFGFSGISLKGTSEPRSRIDSLWGIICSKLWENFRHSLEWIGILQDNTSKVCHWHFLRYLLTLSVLCNVVQRPEMSSAVSRCDSVSKRRTSGNSLTFACTRDSGCIAWIRFNGSSVRNVEFVSSYDAICWYLQPFCGAARSKHTRRILYSASTRHSNSWIPDWTSNSRNQDFRVLPIEWESRASNGSR